MSGALYADLVRRLYDAVNRHDEVALAQLFAPDMVRHDLAATVEDSTGSGEVSNFLQKLRVAMPDLHMELEDVFATGEGRVAARSTLTGPHEGEFLGVAGTGNKVSFAAITLYRVAEGRIAEAWSLVDWAGALRQMTGS